MEKNHAIIVLVMVWSMVHVQLKYYKTKLFAKSTKSRTKIPHLTQTKHKMQKKGKKGTLSSKGPLGEPISWWGFWFVEGSFIPTFIVVATQITFLQIMCNSCCCFNIWYSLFEKFMFNLRMSNIWRKKKVWGWIWDP